MKPEGSLLCSLQPVTKTLAFDSKELLDFKYEYEKKL
jgi:hypothetical protein